MSENDKDLLSQALRDRAEQVGGHPIGMADVRGRARHIRRRRNAVRGAVAAVVLAVAVPAGLSVTDAVTSSGKDTPPVLSRPDDSASPAPKPRADGTFALTLEGLQAGPVSRKALVVGKSAQLVSARGTADLPEPYPQIVPFDGGWLALAAADGGGLETVRLNPDFRVESRSPAGPSMVVDDAGRRVAYVDSSGATRRLVSAPTDGSAPISWPLAYPAAEPMGPVGYLPGGSVVFESLGGVEPTIGIARADGTTSAVEGFLKVRGVSESTGLVSGQVSYDDATATSCSGVADALAGGGDLLWRTCDFALGAFSPDGQYVLGGTPDADGMGSPTLSVLDARTGRVVTRFTPRTRDSFVAVQQAAWEDSETVLAVVAEGVDQAVVRAGVDGSLERAGRTYQERDLGMALWFADQPRL